MFSVGLEAKWNLHNVYVLKAVMPTRMCMHHWVKPMYIDIHVPNEDYCLRDHVMWNWIFSVCACLKEVSFLYLSKDIQGNTFDAQWNAMEGTISQIARRELRNYVTKWISAAFEYNWQCLALSLNSKRKGYKASWLPNVHFIHVYM